MNKEKKMVIIVKKEGGTTSFERIGDDLDKELLGMYWRQIESELYRKNII